MRVVNDKGLSGVLFRLFSDSILLMVFSNSVVVRVIGLCVLSRVLTVLFFRYAEKFFMSITLNLDNIKLMVIIVTGCFYVIIRKRFAKSNNHKLFDSQKRANLF